ncbi:2-dehydropantoate 2-reductase [Flammeovirga pectinis]|uniref:2-dehydropantoate 2-reductase n=1 Tax=Flammeovirga pectinis TaxID=2494373 RepID=A0A3S9P785_9BACT|nr:2-dehydropantoate 2-reductase [Flammeovirga pectinis]AZQ64058.1 2-dehydropantoate 2-reductase [Flammeovirga pectinis]
MRIGILGIGGIGGFIGAQLLSDNKHHDKIEVLFICRGATKKAIKQNGLLFRSDGKEKVVYPHLVSDDPTEIGKLDLLIIATKSYQLKEALNRYLPCLQEETLLLPLLNGVNAKELIASYIPHPVCKILEGCIYIISNQVAPGQVTHKGGLGKVFFGTTLSQDYQWLEKLLKDFGVDANYTRNIKEVIWKKFLFVSPISALTSSYGITFGQLRNNEDYMFIFQKLMNEILDLAKSLKIYLSNGDVNDVMMMLSSFPEQAKTSFQLDIEGGSLQNEKSIFIDYVINKSIKEGSKHYYYSRMNSQILSAFSY